MTSLTAENNYTDQFNRYVLVSIIVHIAVVLVFTTKAIFFPGEPIVFEAAIKVDLVALPDKIDPNETIKNLPTADEKVPDTKLPTKEKKAKDPEAINLEKSKKKESAALAKLKQMSALEEIEKQISEDNKKKALDKLRKGNSLSSGSELKGLNRLQHDNYISSVERHIRQNWSLPEWLSRKNLSAQIRVRFDESGNVISRQIVKSSGNPSFDEVVINTVQMSSPVPAPPAKFTRIMSAEGILFGFPE